MSAGRPPRCARARPPLGLRAPRPLADRGPGADGGNGTARGTLSAQRTDVPAKGHGRDISRKRKRLDKQKEGKKKMRQFGKVDIPQEAFIAALKMDQDKALAVSAV